MSFGGTISVVMTNGFKDYMAVNHPGSEIVNVFIDPKDRTAMDATLDEVFSDCNEEKYIVMFNSRVHLVADYIRKRGLKGCRVVGFDVIERNVAGLKDGTVNVLIAQHSDLQASAAVLSLVDMHIHGKEVSRKDNFTSMDILNVYNCDYYM